MKRALCILISTLLLSGCGGEEVQQITRAESIDSSSDSGIYETADVAPVTAEQPETAEPASEKSGGQLEMEQNILERAPEDGIQGELFPIAFGDLDGSGTEMLVAVLGSMEEYDGKAYYHGDIWAADEGWAYDVLDQINIDTKACALTDMGVIRAGGDVLFTCTFDQGAEYGITALWRVDDGRLDRVNINGCTAVGIAQAEDCEFTAIKTGYGAYTDGTGRIYKTYRYTYDPISRSLEQHLLREVTWEQISGFEGADSISERLDGEIYGYLLTNDGELYINYIRGRENRSLCYDIVDGALVEASDEAGHYEADVTFEQARLEQLILDSVPEEDRRDGYGIGDTLFGDFDGDGTEELAAIYGAWDIWFASGDHAEHMNCGELVGVTQTSDGTFMNFYTPGVIGGVTAWYHLQDSTLVCSQPQDWYSAHIFISEDGQYAADILVGHDEEHGYLWDTVALAFNKEKRQFEFIEPVISDN